MHTVTVIGAGFLLLGVFLLGGHFAARGSRPALGRASLLFIPAWLAVSAVNLWVGVTQAGIPVSVEIPILLVVFGIPAAVAALIGWWYRRQPG